MLEHCQRQVTFFGSHLGKCPNVDLGKNSRVRLPKRSPSSFTTPMGALVKPPPTAPPSHIVTCACHASSRHPACLCHLPHHPKDPKSYRRHTKQFPKITKATHAIPSNKKRNRETPIRLPNVSDARVLMICVSDFQQPLCWMVGWSVAYS